MVEPLRPDPMIETTRGRPSDCSVRGVRSWVRFIDSCRVHSS